MATRPQHRVEYAFLPMQPVPSSLENAHSMCAMYQSAPSFWPSRIALESVIAPCLPTVPLLQQQICMVHSLCGAPLR